MGDLNDGLGGGLDGGKELRGGGADTSDRAPSDGRARALAFFAEQSRLTDPGAQAGLLDGLPRDLPSLCEVVRGLILHPLTAHLYGVRVPESRLGEQDTRGVEAILARIKELDGAPLTTPRPPERRFVGCCRDFSTLLCALLRHQGVPARPRAGCARYFSPELGVDHWVCQYWGQDEGSASRQGRWVLVDAELDETHRAAYGIAFDPHDVPRDAFLVAGEAWRRCRSGVADPAAFGVAPESSLRGWPYLQSQLVRDFASLNKVELLCWDVWGLAYASQTLPGQVELALLDQVATLSLSDEGRFAEMRRHYEGEPRLRVPAVITSFSAAGGWRTPQEVTLWTP
ncbi:MAG TPA: transglutaminase-like domain-containing protein [Chloroflexota bacterium]|nr:transglutaminase-like domain-containing protein [Chloroflexota bacterium]